MAVTGATFDVPEGQITALIGPNGAGGNDDFNKYHNVFSGFQMVGFDSKLNNVVRSYVTPQQLATVVAKEG